MSRNRKLLSQLIKTWAQDHNHAYQIASVDSTDEGISKTGSYLSWVVKEGHSNLNLITLLDALELFMINKRIANDPDGMTCSKCGTFYDFAEPNQDDEETLICFTCRSHG